MATISSPRPSRYFRRCAIRRNINSVTTSAMPPGIIRSSSGSISFMSRCWPALPGKSGNALRVPQRSHVLYGRIPRTSRQFSSDYANGASTTPASDGSFSQSVQRLGLYAQDSWRAVAASHGQLRTALPDHVWTVHRFWPQPGAERRRSLLCKACRFRSSPALRTIIANKLLLVLASHTLPATAAKPCSAPASACSITTLRKMDGAPPSRP